MGKKKGLSQTPLWVLSEEEMEMLVKTLAKLEQWFRGRQDN